MELALSLVLLAVLIWGLGQIHRVLLQKGRAERTIWAYAVSRAHKSPDGISKKHAALAYDSVDRSGLDWRSAKNCRRELLAALISKEKIPATFRASLPFHCGRDIELTAVHPVPPFLRRLKSALHAEIPDETRLKTDAFVPGGDLKGAALVRQAMWQEAMKKAGFPVVQPLQLLGIPEIVSSLGDAGLSGLGSEAMDLITEFKSSGMGGFLGDSFPSGGLSDWIGLDAGALEDRLYEEAVSKGGGAFRDLLAKYRPDFSRP